MTTTRTPRRDQLRNRQRLLDTARVAFAEQGPDVSVEAIARRAGVGATTFYRHFPTKDDLVTALLTELTAGAGQIAERAAHISDDWEAFRTVFTEGCVLNTSDLRLFDILCRTSSEATDQGRRATTMLIAPVARRARRSGLLRVGISVADIAAFMRMADSAVTPKQRRAAQDVLLSGLRASDDQIAPPLA